MSIRKIRVKCPICSKNSFVEINAEMREKIQGITSVSIGNNSSCSHNLNIYLDSNLAVRDIFIADFQFELPQLEPGMKFTEFLTQNKDAIDIFSIKLNFLPNFLTNILHGIFLRKKILVLIDQDFKKSLFCDFINFIYNDTFKIDITVEKVNYCQESQEFLKNFDIILVETKIIVDSKNILSHKKLRVERKIIQNFFAEMDHYLSLFKLHNEIKKAYSLSKTVSDFLKNQKNSKKVETMRIINYIENVHKVKVSSFYLNFLIEIVENYFKINIPTICKNIVEFL
jgi:hypothetical protein